MAMGSRDSRVLGDFLLGLGKIQLIHSWLQMGKKTRETLD